MEGHVFNRYLNLLDYSLVSLKRKKLKNFGVFVVFIIVVFFLSSFQLLSAGLQNISTKLLETVPDITVQQMSAGRQVELPRDTRAKLSDIYGMQNIRERVWGYYFDESNGANYTVVGIDFKEFTKYFSEIGLVEGNLPATNERGAVVIGNGVHTNLNLGARKHFTLFKPDLSQISFKTIARFDRDLDILTSDLIVMSKEDARELFAIDSDQITDLLIDSANPNEVENMARRIAEKTDGTRVITRNQMAKTYRAVFGWRSGVGAIVFLGAIVAFMILAWDKASGLSQEDQKEAAILKSLGWQAGDIMLIRFYESFCLSILAFIIAYGLSWFHVFWLDGVIFRPLLLGWSVLQPTFSFTPIFSFTDFFLIFSLSVVPYWCATIIPAWRSSIVRPESVL